MLVKAEAYEVVARQIMIKFDNIQILKRKDRLNAICVYNIMTDKNKLA
jgi:hypothetical protein